jgi:D-glycero-alpha-D-manno-heptose-7-phosphate kinase
VIEASVPVRICDVGGWTDTWFGGPGRVVNIGVGPRISVVLRRGKDESQHALVDAALEFLPPPERVAIEIKSEVPAGCGAGTSAAVAVALLAALTSARSERQSPRDLAYLAYELEVEVLGNESGIQDQLSVAFGGINYVEIDEYPVATVQQLPEWPELGDRLSLVYLGRAHDSSGVHREVIAEIAKRPSSVFDRLRDAAQTARDAVVAHDLVAFGNAMIANTAAQRALHPSLITDDANDIIGDAEQHGAIGWKVNGAGGDGGSLTILHATTQAKTLFEAQHRTIPIRIEGGLRVTGSL